MPNDERAGKRRTAAVSALLAKVAALEKRMTRLEGIVRDIDDDDDDDDRHKKKGSRRAKETEDDDDDDDERDEEEEEEEE